MTDIKKYTEYFSLFMTIFLMGLIVSAPAVCATGAKRGLSVCAGVLIPALFPFAVPVLFLINTKTFQSIKSKATAVLILSLIGGYPIGAKLISELYKGKSIDANTAVMLLPFCVNAGPAFIVIAVGKGILNNISLGFILLFSHITASVISAVIFLPKSVFKRQEKTNCREISSADNFVLSVKNAADATISICAFVVLFSVINEYIIHFSSAFKPLSVLVFTTEVTYAVSQTNNIYLISFLLGFAGISIWIQILSMCESIKPKPLLFVFSRIFHGVLSALITAIILKLFDVSVYTISNNISTQNKPFYSDYPLSFSLIIMAILLVISITSKKHSGNIIKDMI